MSALIQAPIFLPTDEPHNISCSFEVDGKGSVDDAIYGVSFENVNLADGTAEVTVYDGKPDGTVISTITGRYLDCQWMLK